MSNKDAVLSALAAMSERPQETARSLTAFHSSARVLSRHQPRLIDDYEKQWVAVCDGDVVAHGDSLIEVLEQVDEQGRDRSAVIVRYIERALRTLIL